MVVKTSNQTSANKFDMDLYRLIHRARSYSEDRGHGKQWQVVARSLAAARPTVRDMMHPNDREGTEG